VPAHAALAVTSHCLIPRLHSNRLETPAFVPITRKFDRLIARFHANRLETPLIGNDLVMIVRYHRSVGAEPAIIGGPERCARFGLDMRTGGTL
jgi:hypothetical protein